jgi:cell division transport system ATP-binding protein
MVHLQNVSKVYDSKIYAVNDVSFQVEEGEFVFLIGPSGSGKTTIIKMLIRDENPSSGKVYFNGSDITRISRKKVYKLRREVGVIFQDFKLVADKTAYENVAFAMEAAGKKNKEIKETVPYVLDIVGLSNRTGAFPRQLSGGEQQRVAIARAIANNPKILIADEPTGNLDPASSWDIVQVLTKINNWGTTIIMSTHGTDIVNSLNKRVIQMENGQIIRDDNKGQYELNQVFADNVVEKAEQDAQLQPQDSHKQKKTYQVNLSKSDDEPVETLPVEQPKKNDFFSRLFKVGRSQPDPTPKAADTMPDEPVEHPPAGKPDVIFDDIKDEDAPNIVEVLENDSPEELAESKSLEPEKAEEPSKRQIHVDLKAHAKLAKDRKKEEKQSTTKSSDGYLDSILQEAQDISIDTLDLKDQVKRDLKSAGYNNIADVIKDGPEGLSKHLLIDPQEVVLISKEVKKFLQKRMNK